MEPFEQTTRLDAPCVMDDPRAAVGVRVIITVALLTLANALNIMDRMLVAVLGPAIKYEFGLSDTRFGLLTGPAFALSYASACVFFGYFADTSSRRAIMSLGVGFWSAMTWASGYVSSFLQLSLARAGYGLGSSGFEPAAFSYLSDCDIPPHRRSIVFGVFYAGPMAGVLAAFVLGGGIASRHGWRSAFIVSGIAGVCLAAVLPFLREPRRGNTATQIAKLSISQIFAVLVGNRAYLWGMLGMAIANFSSLGIAGWLPLFFARSHGMDPGKLAFIFGPALALGMIVGMLSGGWIGDRLSRRGKAQPLLICVWANVAATFMYWGILTVPAASVAVIFTVIAAALSVVYIPAYNVMVQSILPPNARATGMSVIIFMTNIFAYGVLPVFVGALSDAMQPRYGSNALRYALIFVLTGGLVGAWAFAKARRDIRAGAN